MDHSQAKFNAAGSREIWCIHLTTLINDNSVKAADKARLKDTSRSGRHPKMLISCAMLFNALRPLSILSLVLQGNKVDIVMSIEGNLNSLKALMSLVERSPVSGQLLG